MTPAKKSAPGPQTGSAENISVTVDHTPQTTTDNAAAFGAAVERKLTTTTRRCEGAYCWCRASATIVPNTEVPNLHWAWRQRMDALAVRIRSLEIEQGPVL